MDCVDVGDAVAEFPGRGWPWPNACLTTSFPITLACRALASVRKKSSPRQPRTPSACCSGENGCFNLLTLHGLVNRIFFDLDQRAAGPSTTHQRRGRHASSGVPRRQQRYAHGPRVRSPSCVPSGRRARIATANCDLGSFGLAESTLIGSVRFRRPTQRSGSIGDSALATARAVFVPDRRGRLNSHIDPDAEQPILSPRIARSKT
jgi:hypothetical protein